VKINIGFFKLFGFIEFKKFTTMKKIIFTLMLFAISSSLLPCSRVMWVGADGHVIVGRNFDWFEDLKINSWVFPQGIQRNGLVKENPLKWTSKYGSFVTTFYELGVDEGVNEKGLVVNALYLEESDYGIRDIKKPGLTLTIWVQFFLDNFATVDEAVKYIQNNDMQVVPILLGGQPGVGHVALGDLSGDNAIIEYIGGKLKIYHSKEYKIMTNTPPFDQQLANLKKYKPFGGNQPIPGSCNSDDRFVRATYFESELPLSANNVNEAILNIFSVMRNIAQPASKNFGDPSYLDISPTVMTTILDLTNGVYYYSYFKSFDLLWVNLGKLNFSKGAPIMKLDLVNNPNFAGDVTGKLIQSEPIKLESEK
jgi:penicillin V acylase-like amidase (Ntn superfamily)